MRKDIIKRAVEAFKEHFRKKQEITHPYLAEYRYSLPVHTVVETTITSWYEHTMAEPKGGDNVLPFPVKPEIKPEVKPEEKK